MHSCSVLVVLCLVAGLTAAASFEGNDKGYAKNCDPTIKFSAWWSPKVLKVGNKYTVAFNFTPNIDWSSGSVAASVFLVSDPTPIYQTVMPISCEQLKPLKLPVQCPFQKGKEISMTMTNVPFRLPYAFPAGQYKIKVKVQDNNAKDLICLEVTIDLANNPSSNDMYEELGQAGKL